MAQGDKIQMIPTGSIYTFPTSAILAGYLECDGAEVSRTTYSALFTVLGTAYGIGNGSTTFNIPDLRGEFIRGFDNGKGTDSGRAIASGQTEATAPNGLGGSAASAGSHSHTMSSSYGSGAATDYIMTSSFETAQTETTAAAGAHTHTVDLTGDAETRPRNIAMMFCIKI